MIKSFLAKIYAKKVAKDLKKWVDNPIKTQDKVFKNLIQQAKNTTFGKDHNFERPLRHHDLLVDVLREELEETVRELRALAVGPDPRTR